MNDQSLNSPEQSPSSTTSGTQSESASELLEDSKGTIVEASVGFKPTQETAKLENFEIKAIGALKGQVVIQTNLGYLTMNTEMAETFHRAVGKSLKKARLQALK